MAPCPISPRQLPLLLLLLLPQLLAWVSVAQGDDAFPCSPIDQFTKDYSTSVCTSAPDEVQAPSTEEQCLFNSGANRVEYSDSRKECKVWRSPCPSCTTGTETLMEADISQVAFFERPCSDLPELRAVSLRETCLMVQPQVISPSTIDSCFSQNSGSRVAYDPATSSCNVWLAPCTLCTLTPLPMIQMAHSGELCTPLPKGPYTVASTEQCQETPDKDSLGSTLEECLSDNKGAARVAYMEEMKDCAVWNAPCSVCSRMGGYSLIQSDLSLTSTFACSPLPKRTTISSTQLCLNPPDVDVWTETLEGCLAAHEGAARVSYLDYKCRVWSAPCPTCYDAPDALVQTDLSVVPGSNGDPHFVGARGTHFDFNGELGQSFCLLSDRGLHINGFFDGYPAPGSSISSSKEKGIRSWIKDLGLLWEDGAGKAHEVVMKARRAKETQRGASGFLQSLTLDGTVHNTPQNENEEFIGNGGFRLRLRNNTMMVGSNSSSRDKDTYTLTIDGILEAEVSLNAEIPGLRKPDDAQVHFNLKLLKLQVTPDVHGILGQTYRVGAGRVLRALEYQMLSKMMGEPVTADGSSGSGFLDGATASYRTSSITAADCSFNQFLI